MEKQAVNSPAAPAAIGPYSHANVAGDLIFISGQLPVKNGELITEDITAATRACMDNVGEILKAAGSDFAHVLRCSIFLTNLGDFAKVNEAYGEYFQGSYPARVCVEVSKLPKNASIEIDAFAVKA